MYKAWSAKAPEESELARAIELHLNEFAEEVISVAYAIGDQHYALVVYRPIDARELVSMQSALAEAVQIIDDAQG